MLATQYHRNVFSHAGATALGSLVQLALILILSHLLPVTEFASFLTAVALVGLGEMAADVGMRVHAVRLYARDDAVPNVLGPALLAKAGYLLLLLVVVHFLPLNLLNQEQAVLAVLIAATQPSTDPLLWFLRGKERLDVEAAVVLAWRVSSAVLLAGMAYSGSGVTALLLAWFVSNLGRSLLTWIQPALEPLRLRKGDDRDRVISLAWSVMRRAFPVGVAFIAMALYHRLGVLLLGELAEPREVAWYGAAFTLVASAGFIATSITASSFPALSRAIETGEWEDAGTVARRKLRWIGTVFFPLCLVTALLAPFLVYILYPDSYAPAARVMVELLPGLYISTINLALKFILNALDRNFADITSVVGGIAFFVATLVLFPSSNLPLLAGLAWSLGEFLIFSIKWLVLMRDGRIRGLLLGWHALGFAALLFVLHAL
ncbi:MAG TPA: hypothetical protein ENK05_09985 [Gammaproteobacteria bacterium]|nr:hypothetical protein [Gammaproteobacteria bacterium]